MLAQRVRIRKGKVKPVSFFFRPPALGNGVVNHIIASKVPRLANTGLIRNGGRAVEKTACDPSLANCFEDPGLARVGDYIRVVICAVRV